MSEIVRTTVAEFGEDPSLFERARRTPEDIRHDVALAAEDYGIAPTDAIALPRQAWKATILQQEIGQKYLTGMRTLETDRLEGLAASTHKRRLDIIKKHLMAWIYVDEDLDARWGDVVDEVITFGSPFDPRIDPDEYKDAAFLHTSKLNLVYESDKDTMDQLTDELVIMSGEVPESAAFFALKAVTLVRSMPRDVLVRLQLDKRMIEGLGANIGISPEGIKRMQQFVAAYYPQE